MFSEDVIHAVKKDTETCWNEIGCCKKITKHVLVATSSDKSPRTSPIVQIIFSFWSFEIGDVF